VQTTRWHPPSTVYADGGGLFGKFIELLRELRPSLRELGFFGGYAPSTRAMG